jgi:Flp pilus assembly protein TadD
MLLKYVSFLGVLLLVSCGSLQTKEDQQTAQEASSATLAEGESVSAQKDEIDPVLNQQYMEGIALMGSGDFESALVVWKSMQIAYPDVPGVLVNKGLAEFNLDMHEEAFSSISEASKIAEDFCPAYSTLGPLYRELGRFEDAEIAYKEAIDCDPYSPDFHYNLGILYDLYMRRPEEALEHYKIARTLSIEEDKNLAIWIRDLSRRLGIPDEPIAPPSAPVDAVDAPAIDSESSADQNEAEIGDGTETADPLGETDVTEGDTQTEVMELEAQGEEVVENQEASLAVSEGSEVLDVAAGQLEPEELGESNETELSSGEPTVEDSGVTQ